MSLTVGSLFSGIGGLELGLEWAGLGPVTWQVEQDAFCCEVLAKHWPDAVRHRDVRGVGAHNLAPVDVVCGGFPCQDLSVAGRGAGLAGARSGLWFEYARVVRELRPRFVVVENVSALLFRGLDAVLGELAALGYDAWWDCVRASDAGAPHRRERLFVVAHARGGGRAVHRGASCRSGVGLADADGAGLEGRRAPVGVRAEVARALRDGDADVVLAGAAKSRVGRVPDGLPAGLDGRWPARPGEPQHDWEPPRTAAKVPRRQARLKALGNAVVPQVAYAIGCVVRALAESEAA